MSRRETTLTLLAASLLLLIGSSSVEIRPCPITSVGKSYRMVCSGKTKTTSRFVLWDREEHAKNTLRDLSRCYFNDPCTILMDEFKYNVSNKANGQTFESVLTILNISHGDVGVTIHCKAMDAGPADLSEPTNISTCQLPVFSLAQPPSCRATPIGPDVQIDCSFPKVHPKLSCRLGYDHDRFEMDSSIEYVENSLAPESPLYIRVNCKGVLKVQNQTQTQYFVKVLPNFNRELSEEALEAHATVLEANLMSTPKVVINMPRYVPICPPGANHTLTLHCSATTTTPGPRFSFFFGDEEVQRQKEPSVYKTADMFSTLQEYRITLDSTSQDKVLRCKIDELYYDTAVVSLATPPAKPPQFLSKEGFLMKHDIHMNENESLSARCNVSGGTPLVSNISVTCVAPNSTRILKVGNFSNVVFFTIAGPETGHGSVCTCTAYHMSGCYNATAWLRIVHIGRDVAPHAPSEGVYTQLLYVAAVFVGLIVIPILVAMCVFVYRNWDQLYTRHPPASSNHYDYIDPERPKKKQRRKSSHSESSVSVNSDYMSRYRDHIVLHNLENGAGKKEENQAPPPPCIRRGNNNNNVKNEVPRTPSESDSQYESRIPVFPTRNKSGSSYEDDEQPARTKTSNHGDGNRSSRHTARRSGRPSSPRARTGNYRYSRSSYDSSRRSFAEEHHPDDDDDYVSPVTPFSSEEEEGSLSRSPSLGSGGGDRRSWEGEEIHGKGDEDTWRKKEAKREEDEEDARRAEVAYLLKRLERNAASSDEDLP